MRRLNGTCDVLALTIALETGDIGRFAGPGNFASYARTVKSTRESNGKKKGQGNTKCGNKYLAWAFIEDLVHKTGRARTCLSGAALTPAGV